MNDYIFKLDKYNVYHFKKNSFSIDYDNGIVNNFIVYDGSIGSIGLDSYLTDRQFLILQKKIIKYYKNRGE